MSFWNRISRVLTYNDHEDLEELCSVVTTSYDTCLNNTSHTSSIETKTSSIYMAKEPSKVDSEKENKPKQKMEKEKNPQPTTEQESREVKNDDISKIKSPYLDYDNLEDFNMKAYGAKGHQEPKAGLGGGVTDAPTPSGGVGRGGGAASSDLSSTGAINRQGVP
ncbi:unnamed protein product [Thlaspi arvense]|uniref:Uncharacterized protein n=1 Tax=Thlaspi arvense TaxID=13288 RepID=A0AAU9SCC3_THLAR|nr:unnamed protein product [Thlaspi arvense]